MLPGPLVLLLAAVALLGGTWALLVPPWQTPDEFAHFGYVQEIGEGPDLPGDEPGERFSREQELASDRSNAVQLATNLSGRAEWSELERREWGRADEALGDSKRGDGGGAPGPGEGNPARTNPPLYYVYESLPYLAASAAGGDIFSRLTLMRLASVLFLLVAVAATWKLIGELTGDRQLLQLAGAGVVGLQPMAVFVSASVNPDSLLVASFAVAMLFGVRILQRGLTLPRGVALCVACAVAVLTKGTGYALVPPMLLVLALGGFRVADGWGSRATAAAVPALGFFVPVGAWLVAARLAERPAINQIASGPGLGVDLPGPVSYLWQFYLPKLPLQTALPGAYPRLPAFDAWVQGGWAAFGWLEVIFPAPVYVALAAATLVLVLGGALAAKRHAAGHGWATPLFLALVALAVLGGLHAAEYKVLTEQATRLNQGRYLLPLLPLLGVAAAGSLALLGERARRVAAGGLLGCLFALQVFSLGLVAVRFYA